MKRKLVISACLAVLTLSSFGYYVFSHSSYPEAAIVGEWKEVSWVYDRNNVGEKVKQVIDAEERMDIANHLVIHEFENWTFRKNYSIKLHERTGKEHQAKWRLKDRGRILTLLNDDGTTEVYSVESLKKNELVLHFDTDVHARGIVKITLKKLN
ncbi:lipocalin family protein [Fluviicola sp.]|uniref:lipocalin family protein n=1 Tax=Fluviicola sp. TaxID=1917219 RepID=UPI003D27C47C